MVKKVLAEVDLTALAVPVAEKPTRKRKAPAAKPVEPEPEPVVTKNVSETVEQETVKTKKPRTEKQLAADAKRREAALAKKAAKEEEDRKIKEAEVRAFEEAAAKKQAAAEKRKAAREAKKAAELQSPSESEAEDKPQLPIASSVPPVKERKKREPKVEFTQVHSRGAPGPRPRAEDLRGESLQDVDAARKRRIADQARKRAAIYGSNPAPRHRMR